MLTTLRNLVKECLLRANVEEIMGSHQEETVEKFEIHSKILQALVGGKAIIFNAELDFDHVVVLLDNLRKLLKAWENHKEEVELERSDREVIKDILIWRCILIYILFSTAPDNSKILTSGTWEQVVPII